MFRRSFKDARTLLVAIFFAACASAPPPGPPRAEPGLSNAPVLARPASEGTGHDAVSTGLESCPPSGRREDDPLKHRITRCPESGPLMKKPPKARPPSQ